MPLASCPLATVFALFELHGLQPAALRAFNTTLGPQYNAAHRDHLHVDMGPYRLCR